MRQSGTVKTHQIYSLPTFSGGLWLDDSPLSAPEGRADRASNVLINSDGSISTRPGKSVTHAARGSAVPLFVKGLQYRNEPVLLTVYNDRKVYLNNTLVGTLADGISNFQAWNASERLFVCATDSVTGVVYEITGDPPVLYALSTGTGQMNEVYNPPLVNGGIGREVRDYYYRVTGYDSQGNESPSLLDYYYRVFVGETRTSTELTFQISASSPYVGFNVYRKDPGEVTYKLMGSPVTIETINGMKRFIFDATETLTRTARIAPETVFMTGRGLSVYNANRLWSVQDNKLYYSNAFDPTAREALAVEKISMPDNAPVTALVPYNQGVLLFTRRSAAYVTGPPMFGGQFLPLNLSSGCIGPHAWTYVDNQLFFVGPDGLYAFTGNSAQQVSQGVNRRIQAITDKSHIFLTYVPTLNVIALACPGEKLLCFCLTAGKIVPVEWNIFANGATLYQDCLTFSETLSRTVCSLNAEDDAGAAIVLLWRSTPLNFGDPSLWKLFRRAEAYFTALSPNTKVTLALQEALGDGDTRFEESYTSGVGTSLTRVRVPANLQGRYVQIELQAEARQGTRPLIAPPINVEFRVRDRMGR